MYVCMYLLYIHAFVCTYTYIYIYICGHMYMCVYIYVEGERERETERGRKRGLLGYFDGLVESWASGTLRVQESSG